MKRFVLCLLSFLFGGTSLSLAQGFEYDPAEDENLPVAPRQYSGTKSGTDEFVIDLTPYCPLPILQSGNSCVSAATVSAYAIQRALQHKADFKNRPEAISQQYMLSPMLPYRQVTGTGNDCSKKLSLMAAAAYIQNNGNVTLAEWPELSCKIPISSDLLEKAGARQGKLIKGAQKVFKATASDEEKLGAISYWLSKGVPILVGMHIDGPSLKSFTSGHYASRSGAKEGHAVVLVGYDAIYKEVTLLNSYGPAWGNRGLFKMKFADFLNKAVLKQAVILTLSPDNAPGGKFQLGGSFGFQSIRIDAQGLHNQRIEAKYAGQGIYEMPRKNWKPFVDRFQLLTRNDHPGEYMAVFSLDSAGKVDVHWPKNQALNEFNDGFDDMTESDLLPVSQFELIIPSENSAMQLTHAGQDYLCVLYSSKPLLPELPQILQRFGTTPGDVMTRLKTALGNRLVPNKSVQYQANTMQFSAAFDQGDTVPIVLKVEATY